MSSESTLQAVDSTPESTVAATSAPDSSNLSEPKSPYVPPHLRHKLPVYPTPTNTMEGSQTTTTITDIPSEKKPFQRKTFTATEIYRHFGVVHGGTINPSINNHKELAYILIFRNQHPQYPPKIFVKSNLELIFKDAAKGDDINPILETLDIPLFEEEHQYRSKLFKFKSWVRVQKVERLEKGSEALIEMLTEKWRSDTPRRTGFEMREREKSRREEKMKKENALTITKAVEVGENGQETVVENRIFKDDPDDSEDKNSQVKQGGPGKPNTDEPLSQKLEQTVPRSEVAWKTSLSVDWGVVTLEFVENGKENPLYGSPVQLAPPPIRETSEPTGDLREEIDQVLKATGSMKLDNNNSNSNKYVTDGKKTIRGARGEKSEKVKISKILQMDGADDTVLVNDDLDSASIPSSPVLEPATPKKGSAINLPAYALQSSGSHPHQEKGSAAGGLSISQSDISQSYISTGMGDSMAEDFGTISAPSETEAEESDRWSELSEHDRPDDENWMAVERGGMAKEVY
ncbi:hypothetical protein TWF730_004959 [Orbilia blumenaviensis]|uniref:Uncharacterized protein n=1 Tax=Orbilia blumenaviensis TaxID=1796055 RepID=A0AAV9VK53_9PEZI